MNLLDLEKKLRSFFSSVGRATSSPITAQNIGQPVNFNQPVQKSSWQVQGGGLAQQVAPKIAPVIKPIVNTALQQPLINNPTFGIGGFSPKLPFSPTIGEYTKGQIVNPLRTAVNPNAPKLDRAIGAVQGGFSLTPAGTIFNVVGGGAAGALRSLRTGQNINQSMKQAISNPSDVGGTGLGIKNPLLAMGVDVLTGNPKASLKQVGKLASLKNMNFEDLNAGMKAVQNFHFNKTDLTYMTNQGIEDAKTINYLADKYIGKQFAKTAPIEQQAQEVLNWVRNQNGQEAISMGIRGKPSVPQAGLYDTGKAKSVWQDIYNERMGLSLPRQKLTYSYNTSEDKALKLLSDSATEIRSGNIEKAQNLLKEFDQLRNEKNLHPTMSQGQTSIGENSTSQWLGDKQNKLGNIDTFYKQVKSLFPESRVAEQPLADVSLATQAEIKHPLALQGERGLSASNPSQISESVRQVKTLGLPQTKSLAQEAKSQGMPIIKEGNSPDNIISYSFNKADKLYTEALDRFHPISKLGKTAGEDQAMRNALTGYYGAGSMARYKVDYELAPILKSVDTNTLRQAAIALRDAELKARGIQGSNTGALEGLMQSTVKDPKVGEALKALYKYQDNLVKENLVDTGIMSKEAYQAMKAKNQFYVPFQRVMDQVDEYLGGVPQSRGAGSVGSQNVIRGIKGSDKTIKDPLESIIANTYKTVGLGQRQKVAKAIVSLKDKLPEGMIKEVKGELGNKPNISVFENGKVKHYSVPAEVADAAKGMSEEQLNTVIKILSAPTKVFRATATGVNPEFAIPNVARDIQSAFLNAGVNPLKWVSGLAHMIKKDQVYQDFLKSGGMTERVSLDQPYLKQSLEGITSKGGISIKKPSDIYELMKSAGAYSEQPTRIASFQKAYGDAIKQGLSRDEAMARGAYAAQEATVNFARRGSKTQSVNAIYAFLNARAQGIDRLARTVKNDPKGAAIRLGMITVAPALGLYAYNRNFKSYNDPRVVSQNDKNNNFIIMLSDQPISRLGGAQFIKIPKGEIGSLANPLEAFLSYIDGNKVDGGQAIGSALQAFSPISDIGGVIPTTLRPIVEQAANTNFFYGNNIVPDYKKNYPAGNQDTSTTAPIFRMIGQKTNISPARLQAGVEGYGTGLAKIGEMALNPLVPQQYKTVKNEQGADINKTPVLRRILGGEKKTVEEQQASLESQAKSLDFQMNDIKSGVKRGDISYDQGMKQIEQLKQKQADLLKQSGAGGTIKGDQITYQGTDGGIKTFDLTPTTKGTSGTIGSFANSDWYQTQAAKLWNTEGIPQETKNAIFKKWGIDPNDARYAALTTYSADVSAQYIKSKSPDHQTLLNNLVTGRVVGITGSQFASNGVIDKLNEQGLLSDSEAKALKAMKLDKNGKSIAKIKTKKPGKVTIAKSAPAKLNLSQFARKAPPTIKLSKASVVKPGQRKTIKLGVPQQKISYKIVGPSKFTNTLDRSVKLV